MAGPAHTGMSRTTVQRNHALVTPESHVPVTLPGWINTEVVVLISAEMGAKFEQTMVTCHAGAELVPLRAADELFVLVTEGAIALSLDGKSHELAKDHFCYLPHQVECTAC